MLKKHSIVSIEGSLKLTSLLLGLLTCLLTIPAASKAASLLDPNFNAGVANGDASIYVTRPLADGKILVGGRFTSANGQPRGYLVRLNSDGSTDTTFNNGNGGPDSTVYDILPLTGGKILVGGAFATYNGVAQRGLVRLNADGTLDPTFNPGGSGIGGTSLSLYVKSIRLQPDTKILAGGIFTSYNGLQRRSVIRLNTDGTPDTSFISPYTSSSPTVEELVLQPDGKILAGNSSSLFTLDRLNTDGSLDPTFPRQTSTVVYSVSLLSDGKILVGGQDTFLPAFRSIKRLNADGSDDNDFLPQQATAVNLTDDITVQPDGKILYAGIFSNDGLSTVALRRLNPDGTTDNLFSAPAGNSNSTGIAVQADGKILLSGSFSTINGQSKIGLVRINSDGTIDNSFNASFFGHGAVYTLTRQPDGKFVAGGSFHQANAAVRQYIARYHSDGSLDASFDPGTGPMADFFSADRPLISDTEIQTDGKILVGGILGGINGQASRSIARFNPDGTVDSSFHSFFTVTDFLQVYDLLTLPDGQILTSFENFGNLSFDSRIVKINPDGSFFGNFWSMQDTVYKMTSQPDGKILIGGILYTPSDAFVGIERLNADGSLDASFQNGTGCNNVVRDMIVQPDGKILIAGSFTTVNGIPRNRIARLNANGSLDTSFDPGTGADSTVWKIALLPNGKVAVGGSFGSFNSVVMSRLAILNTDGSRDASFTSGFDNNPANVVRSMLVQTDGKLLVGGYFQTYDGQPRNSLVRLLTAAPKAVPFDFDGDRKSDLSIFRPSNGEWWYQRSSDEQVPATQFGTGTDKLVPADFTGDGKSDIAVWRPGTGEWFILRSEDGSYFSIPFGTSGDIPAPADFDGDGKADLAVFRPSSGTWFINKSAGGTDIVSFGTTGDFPVTGDYDGDGRADIAIFRPSTGEWWLDRSTSGVVATTFGVSTDKPVQGDFTGDGKTDIAFYRPSSGEWFILRSEDSSYFSLPFGTLGDVPAPGDYDGDGKTDPAVFRPAGATWYVQRSTAGLAIRQFGLASDSPVPAAFVP
jgi:uncharacterized delta-60 repeat protein